MYHYLFGQTFIGHNSSRLQVSLQPGAFLTSQKLVPWFRHPACLMHDWDDHAPIFGPGCSKPIVGILWKLLLPLRPYCWNEGLPKPEKWNVLPQPPCKKKCLLNDKPVNHPRPRPNRHGFSERAQNSDTLFGGNPSTFSLPFHLWNADWKACSYNVLTNSGTVLALWNGSISEVKERALPLASTINGLHKEGFVFDL